MKDWPQMNDTERMARLLPGAGLLDVVLDTDTFNEVDDQFALCYALLSPERMRVVAIYAAPFLNERVKTPQEGMEKSYREIGRLLALLDHGQPPVYRGATRFMERAGHAVPSAAAEDLVRRALAHSPERPLYVIAIGAITNVAAALLAAPEIAGRMVVIWLGGHALYWPDTREFNLREDIPAARTVLDSGVPLLLVPCLGVASHMLVSVYELQACIGDANPLCDALVALVAGYTRDPFGWAKPLWDVAAVAALMDRPWTPGRWVRSPGIDEECCWTTGDEGRHIIRIVDRVDRNGIFRDMFEKLRNA